MRQTTIQEIDLSASFNRLKVALVSKPGEGKTWCMATFPAPIAYICFDPDGYMSLGQCPAAQDKDIDMFVFSPSVETAHDWSDFAKLVNRMPTRLDKEGKAIGMYATVAIDSMTFLQSFCMSEVLRVDGRDRKALQIAKSGNVYANVAYQEHYGILAQQIEQVLLTLLALPCCLVVSLHVRTELTNENERLDSLAVVGKVLPPFIATAFSLIMTLRQRTGVDGQTIVTCDSRSLFDTLGKRRFTGLGNAEPPDFNQWKQKVLQSSLKGVKNA